MSKRTRALVLGATLAAMNLAGTTAVAQTHTNEDPASNRHRALGQLKLLAAADHVVASQEQPTDAVARFRRGERASQEQPTTAEAVEAFRRGERASQEQPTTADARRPPTEAQVGESWRHPASVPVRPAEPSGQPGWLVLGLGVLAAALALSAGLAVTTTRRARHRVRAGQAA
jgi:hypothetical protein